MIYFFHNYYFSKYDNFNNFGQGVPDHALACYKVPQLWLYWSPDRLFQLKIKISRGWGCCSFVPPQIYDRVLRNRVRHDSKHLLERWPKDHWPLRRSHALLFRGWQTANQFGSVPLRVITRQFLRFSVHPNQTRLTAPIRRRACETIDGRDQRAPFQIVLYQH